MRIHLKIKTDYQTLPFDHQSLLVGVIHKWLGWNELHGNTALFSFSRLEGIKPVKNGFEPSRTIAFYFSSFDAKVVKALIKGISADPTMFCGLTVQEIVMEQDPDLSQRDYFLLGSPIFIKQKVDSRTVHYLYTDEEAEKLLVDRLRTKMKIAGIEDDTLQISFDKNYRGANTKLVTYNGIKNRANWCPVIIKGKPETKLFAWNVGLGNSTGIGFGAIK